jgi:hypothetical protein
MNRYWIDFGSGRDRVLDYDGYEIAGTNEFPSRPKFQFILKFKMHRNVRIRFDQRDEIDANELILIDAICSLSLRTSQSRNIIKLDLYRQDDRRMYTNGYYFFSTFIRAQDAESLARIIKGETIILGWEIRGYASVVRLDKSLPIMRFCVNNWNDEMWPSISPDEYLNNILKKLGLDNKYMVEFPFEIPSSIKSHSGLPTGINGLLSDLLTLVNYLETAISIIRNPRSTNDYRQVMDLVKSSVDSIRSNVKNNRIIISKELFIDTGIITNIDPGGGDKAAEEIIEKVGDIMESIYQIASKPAHTKPRKGQPQLRFNISPEEADAQFVLVVGLASSKYLIEKINNYINFKT